MIRFDDLTREERYFSATILSYLLAYDKFAGFIAFESALKAAGIISSSAQILVHPDIQLLTEVYPERDLPYYGVKIPSQSFIKKQGSQTKPDLLLINDDRLYLFECKFFTNDNEYKLHEQIMKQKYIIDIVENTSGFQFNSKVHLLILPYEYSVQDCVVMTWGKLYQIFKSAVPEDDYFMQRLHNAVQRV